MGSAQIRDEIVKALKLDLIVAERVPSRGLGAAIMDRLERAAKG